MREFISIFLFSISHKSTLTQFCYSLLELATNNKPSPKYTNCVVYFICFQFSSTGLQTQSVAISFFNKSILYKGCIKNIRKTERIKHFFFNIIFFKYEHLCCWSHSIAVNKNYCLGLENLFYHNYAIWRTLGKTTPLMCLLEVMKF